MVSIADRVPRFAVLIGRKVRRTATFESWTWHNPTDADRIRASWPTWRKAVRPLGLAVLWAMIVGAGFAHRGGRHPTIVAANGAFIVGIAIVGACVIYGTLDGHRTRKRIRQVGPATTAANLSAPPDNATE